MTITPEAVREALSGLMAKIHLPRTQNLWEEHKAEVSSLYEEASAFIDQTAKWEAEVEELKREAELFDEAHADQNRMVDAIANRIGIPQDEELTLDGFNLWFSDQAIELTALRRQRDDLQAANTGYVERARKAEADVATLDQAFTETCDELGCKYDNEEALFAVDALKTKLADANALLAEAGGEIDAIWRHLDSLTPQPLFGGRIVYTEGNAWKQHKDGPGVEIEDTPENRAWMANIAGIPADAAWQPAKPDLTAEKLAVAMEAVTSERDTHSQAKCKAARDILSIAGRRINQMGKA